MKSFLRVVLVIIIFGALTRMFLIDSFYVSGDSMASTIQDGDYVFVNKLAYWSKKPQRGDVVVSSLHDNSYQHIIKRIVALPGERIKIEHSQVFLKKERIDEWTFLTENYLKSPDIEKNRIKDVGITYITIDPKEYFALGDNRMVSIDSRVLGSIN